MLKKLMILVTVLMTSHYSIGQTVTINESAGWLESAYVKWQPVSGAQSYNVYYSGNGVTNKKIDDPLIRSYGSYFRADVLGLKAGTYTLKVAPVISGTEGTAATTGNLTVKAHDRSGFAFANGRVPGAYNADGTPKSGAVILYVTEKTKNTISLDVTGASANPCVGLQTILDAFKKGKDTRPLIIRMVGQITDLSYMMAGDIVIENSNNAASFITLEGVGEDAVADGWGVRIKNASNIEIRNIATMNCNSGEGDNVGLQQGNDYVWVHNVDLFYGDAGSDADQAKGDGALDCKKSTYVTFAYNHFWDTGKSNLLGLSEGTTSGLYVTYHHNWYDHSDSRHPRVRYYSAHIYNNYYDGNSKYGVGSTLGSSLLVEGNYFRNCKYPILTSMQGSDIFDESSQSNNAGEMATFSKEAGGSIKAFNNYMIGQKRFVPYGASGYPNSTVDFDAFVATSRNQTMASNIKSSSGGNTHNNFDTNSSIMYSYTADSPEVAMANVKQYAGRQNGGDFKWTFNNSVDDASYDLNVPLKSALTSYKTKLVYIQGEGQVVVPTPDPVVNLTTTAGQNSVTLNWTVSNLTATGYEVYRDTDSDPSGRVKLSNVSASTTTYNDATAVGGTTYYYWIKANGSVDSNAMAATPTAATSNGTITLNATAGNATVNLSWTTSNLTVTALEVYRDTDADPAGRTKLATLATNATTYADTTVSNGTTYYYWIKANTNLDSNSVTATPAGSTTPGNGATIYVATNGSANNPGTQALPTTFEKALTTVTAGGTIFVKGGTYNFSSTILITANGSSALNKVFAYDGTPILNFSAMVESTSNRGIVLDGDYWHFKGIIIENAGDNGMLLSGNNNKIENCIFRKNKDTGLQLSRYNTSATSISQWPSNNLILNCEAYDNHDSTNENADGFAAKLTCGTGNIFRGCVSHHNIDDGWDLYTKSDTGPIGAILFEDCIAHDNGILTTGGTTGSGDKNGFKLGSSSDKVNHIVRRCIAYNNGKHGFTDNGNIGSIEFTNNTSYNNAEYNIHTRDGATHVWKNNLSFGNSTNDRIIGTKTAPNSFIGANGGFSVSSSDFETLTPGPNATPTANGFLKLKAGSSLIDAGVTSTGITYNGSKPDLGAIEYGSTVVVPTGTVTLTATAGDAIVTLNWTIADLTATSFEVYRDTDADPSGRVKLANLTATANNYTDATALNGTTYYYWIKANGVIDSNSASATPQAAVVGTVTLSATAGNASVNLNWTTTNLTATSFEVYRDTDADPAGRTKLTAISTSTTSYTDATAVNGTTYYYWIKANGSINSNAASATPQAPVSGTINLTATAGNASVALNWTINNLTITGLEVYRDTDADPAGRTKLTAVSTSTTSYTDATAVNGTTYYYWIKANASINSNAASATPAGSTTPSTPTRIENSDAGTISYDGALKSYPNADNGITINLSNDSGKEIVWNYNANTAGSYQVSFRYTRKASMNPSAIILINGVSQTLSLSETASGEFTTSAINANLVSGNNTIILRSNATGESADIDWIEIKKSGTTSKMVAEIITEEIKNVEISVYPNPTTDYVTVQTPENTTTNIAVYNTSGQLIFSKEQAKGDQIVDLTQQSNGIYFVRILNGKKEIIKKIIKK
ncbi:pectate lyase family protein [Flavobacterium agrisoli]|uniref:T9SS type A sorting domain-containing protein n=1 Tax=Flavobacterium agrisoli TaxID=2793066 RepID=A0A934PMU1_9FLAO|nr:T9SS type A sorting domain-containing protein [Flavobacterium agrisoli]MBK0370120.1 T9SS type A sorting domain-containing protein [Flavobacterium agrisoli]